MTQSLDAPATEIPGDTTPGAPDDIVVISDLHMGRGKNAQSGRYYSLEAFFYDADFRAFCGWLCKEAQQRGRRFTLVINGDAFDFLRIEPRAANDPGSGPGTGLILTPQVVGRLVEQIFAGHPQFLGGLCDVLRAGHRIVFLPGNHDVELQWESTQATVRECVRRRLEAEGATAVDAALERLRFHSWFYYEPGRIWIEHGCQYDPENSFRFLLRRGLAAESKAVQLAEQDQPLGNFFQRYLYNHFGHITFIVPSTRANLRYMRWLLVNQPRLLMGVILRHVPFLLQIVRRLGKAMDRSALGVLRHHHDAELARLAQLSGLGERLHRIDALKEMRADVVQATRAIGWQLIKMVAVILLVALLSVGLWQVGFLSITQLKAGFGVKTLMFLSLNFMALSGALGALVYMLARSSPPPVLPLRDAAHRIADIADVPIVAFGHTHDEVVYSVGTPTKNGRPRWYYNTGTWIAVFTHDVLLPRERVQYTFLRLRGDEADLLQWSPGRSDAMPVILLEDSGPGFLPPHPGEKQALDVSTPS